MHVGAGTRRFDGCMMLRESEPRRWLEELSGVCRLWSRDGGL